MKEKEIEAVVIRANGTMKEVTPKNGSDFTLEELKSFIGGGFIEVVFLGSYILVVDEEGMLKEFPMNGQASMIARQVIVGDVLLCKSKYVK